MKIVKYTSILVIAALVLFFNLPALSQDSDGGSGRHKAACSMGKGGGQKGGMMQGGKMGHGKMGRGKGHGIIGSAMAKESHMTALKKELGLSDEQFKMIKAIHSSAQKNRIEKKATQKIAKLDLQDLIMAPSIDMDAAKEKISEIQKIKSDLMLSRIEKFKSVREILTPGQYEKLFEMKPWSKGGRH